MANGAPIPAPDPNAWATLVDYLKTMVTLSSGLLGVTVTFSSTILTNDPTTQEATALLWTWVCLAFSTAGAVLGIAFCVEYVRKTKKGGAAIFFANFSFFTLLAAAICFLIVGYFRLE